jgi:hypothetical protein
VARAPGPDVHGEDPHARRPPHAGRRAGPDAPAPDPRAARHRIALPAAQSFVSPPAAIARRSSFLRADYRSVCRWPFASDSWRVSSTSRTTCGRTTRRRRC